MHNRRTAQKAGHGNDTVWKARKAMKAASQPSHTFLEIPAGFSHSHGLGRLNICLLVPVDSNHSHGKELVTDVSDPQRNASPGTLRGRSGLEIAGLPTVRNLLPAWSRQFFVGCWEPDRGCDRT